MTASSTKKRSRNSFFLAAGLCLLVATPPARAVDYNWNLRYDFRYGYHLLDPRDLATARHTLETEQKLTLENWTLVADVRAYGDTAYATNSTRYQGPVVSQESQEIVPRDLYLQYKSDHLILRLGNQQVVWGEAFGFYYADIVNPKDLRELGIGDLEAERLPTPMLNAKVIYGDYSLQFLYLPKPFFDKIPNQGSDFATPFYQQIPPNLAVTVNNDLSGPLSLADSELGLRATALVSGIDLSAFYLWYLDRLPAFLPRFTGPQAVTLDAQHPRISSGGMTATADLSMFLLRAEVLYTADRMLTGFSNGAFFSTRSDQMTGVVGLDYTQIEKWRVGMQISESYLIENASTPLIPRSLPLVSLHANGTPWKQHSLDVILSYVINDGSTLTEARYWIPATDNLEIGAGIDLWQGGRASQFGQFQQGSRGYGLLRAYLGK